MIKVISFPKDYLLYAWSLAPRKSISEKLSRADEARHVQNKGMKLCERQKAEKIFAHV